MIILLANIGRPANNNMAGAHQLWYCPVDLVSAIPDGYNGLVNVAFNTGGQWFSIYATPETLQYTEPGSVKDGATVFKQTLTGSFPKDDPGNNETIQEMEQRRHIIKYIDNNGVTKVVGTLDSPLKFSLQTDTGGKTSSANENKFIFTTESPDRAIYYAGT